MQFDAVKSIRKTCRVYFLLFKFWLSWVLKSGYILKAIKAYYNLLLCNAKLTYTYMCSFSSTEAKNKQGNEKNRQGHICLYLIEIMQHWNHL